ncbi:TonB-dependent receptor plug domain-containing protein [Pontibacter sp. G13]|uniref:TonB-dependent receptor n=1 Tax=Pontibacter sp. G13 TaxID=3074898 RepID=UPI00288ADC92|nr:TonB-dependent receptor plug domain-containing protein [Pontibacter sp. G13]WNJ18453.1 TonB-dependent receptor plug domain-containing protein [Pontibacter sp. G13]
MKSLLLVLLFFLPLGLSAQIQISGIVRTAHSGEPISYTRIHQSGTANGRLSNELGYFSLKCPVGKVQLEFHHMGFQDLQLELVVARDTFLEISLEEAETSLDTVSITTFQGVRDMQLGRTSVPMSQINLMPALGGEGDVLKSLQLLPGIQFGMEGTAGLFVRGGSPDQNLILLDEIPVYNVNHLFGFFSLFPPDVVQDVEVYKGAFPAEYGGRLSSVIRIQSKEGSLDTWKGQFSLSPLAGQVQVEGPLVPGRSSIFFAGRRSLVDLILRPFTQNSYQQADASGSLGYYFHDMVFKANYLVSAKTRVFLSVYSGRDQGQLSISPLVADSISTQTDGALGWGNLTASLRLQQVIGEQWFSKTTFGYTHYRYAQELGFELYDESDLISSLETGNRSFVRDLILKQDFEGQLGSRHTLKLGGKLSFKRFEPDVQILNTQNGNVIQDSSFHGTEYLSGIGSLYAGYRYEDTRWEMYAGVRGDQFWTEGKYWTSLQPRLQAAWYPHEKWKAQAGYSRVQQYLHLLSNSGMGLPTDLWVPATRNAPPASSDQLSIGLFHEWDHRTTLSLEAYWKRLEGVIAYRDGTSYLSDFSKWEDRIEGGGGNSRGIELFLHRKSGRLNGWISYTLSKATRKFSQINDGIEFPFRYDRRHNLSILANFVFPDPRKSISVTWMYVSGARTTIPEFQVYTPFDLYQQLQGSSDVAITYELAYLFGHSSSYARTRNNFQIRPFHKMDIAFRSEKQKKRGLRIWEVGIYNAYGQQNPYFVYFGSEWQAGLSEPVRYKPVIQEYSYLMWIPYLSYSLKFGHPG